MERPQLLQELRLMDKWPSLTRNNLLIRLTGVLN